MRIKSVLSATAVLALATFFLPWFTVSFNGQTLGQFSGYQLAVGAGEYALDGLNGRPILFLIPLAALIILLIHGGEGYKLTWRFFGNLADLVVALWAMLILFWQFWRGGDNEALIFTGELGFWLTWLCFGSVFIGALWLSWKRIKLGAKPNQKDTGAAIDVERDETSLMQPMAAVNRLPEKQNEVILPKTATKNLKSLSLIADDTSLQAWFLVVEGAHVGMKYLIDPPVRIGRDPGNDLVVDDNAMSGYHAIVREQGGAYHIQDLNSTNGIYLENNAVHRWHRVPGATLVNEMQIKLGRTVFQVVIEEQNK